MNHVKNVLEMAYPKINGLVQKSGNSKPWSYVPADQPIMLC